MSKQDEGEDEEEEEFEKLGTSLIQSSLANKSPRWREHDSQRANMQDDSSSSDDMPDDDDDDDEDAAAGKAADGPAGELQFGID
jgi:hypothetical protein